MVFNLLKFNSCVSRTNGNSIMQIATVKASPRMLLQRTIVVRAYKMVKEIDR